MAENSSPSIIKENNNNESNFNYSKKSNNSLNFNTANFEKIKSSYKELKDFLSGNEKNNNINNNNLTNKKTKRDFNSFLSNENFIENNNNNSNEISFRKKLSFEELIENDNSKIETRDNTDSKLILNKVSSGILKEEKNSYKEDIRKDMDLYVNNFLSDNKERNFNFRKKLNRTLNLNICNKNNENNNDNINDNNNGNDNNLFDSSSIKENKNNQKENNSKGSKTFVNSINENLDKNNSLDIYNKNINNSLISDSNNNNRDICNFLRSKSISNFERKNINLKKDFKSNYKSKDNSVYKKQYFSHQKQLIKDYLNYTPLDKDSNEYNIYKDFNTPLKYNRKSFLENFLKKEELNTIIDSSNNDFNFPSSKSCYRNFINYEIEKEIYSEINYNFKSKFSSSEIPWDKFGYFNYLKTYDKNLTFPKKISDSPYKTLDAPNLRDDYYLHLMDWNKNDLLAVGLEKSIYIWMGDTHDVINLHNYSNNFISSVSWINNQENLCIGLGNGSLHIWDIKKNSVVKSYSSHKDRVAVIAPQHHNNFVFSSGSQDRQIFNFDLRVKDSISSFNGHSQEVCGLKWSLDDRYLASGGNDNKLFIWSLKKNKYEQKFIAHKSAIKAIDWSPYKYGYLLTGGGTIDRTLKQWNINQMKLVDSIITESQVCNISFSKNTREFVTTHGYSDNLILVWDSEKMEVKKTLKGHKERVIYLSQSPDGRKIATGAGDETIRFWEVFGEKNDYEEEENIISKGEESSIFDISNLKLR